MAAPLPVSDSSPAAIEAFIARWSRREGGQERANYALFLIGLTRLLGLPEPDPAGATHEFNDYVFERAVATRRDDTEGRGRIDLYKRDCFVLEAKQSRLKGAKKEVPGQSHLFLPENEVLEDRIGPARAWDALMLDAKRQAEDYARALPASHGWPPFILVCDVGRVIEVFADFSGQGKNYTQFPDRPGYRIRLEDLRVPAVRKRLRAIWLDPMSLDPSRHRAAATRAIATRLAAVSRRLERAGHAPEVVAHFIMRCVFTMFAESVGLLLGASFRALIEECRDQPEAFPQLVGDLWASMDRGSPFCLSVRSRVLHFNGALFQGAEVLPLGREEIGELAIAAEHDWREVEPAIFGTLLEQALDPAERRRLGAHYTPRAYVERLVVATVIAPLREDWLSVQAVAEDRRAAGNEAAAAAAVRAFHDTLCRVRILDPACGTGNFLYVALELMKTLEGEVLEALVSLGGQEALAGLSSHSVDPHQFLGLELNPRAAAIAELVLWIGYLQQHFRTKGGIPQPPILRAFGNIRHGNAILTWTGAPAPAIVDGRPTRPDPRAPAWPEAEFIVGNPPFTGGKDLRGRLPPGEAEALWAAHPHINPSADLVMYWWDRAADLLTRPGTALRRFGFVTTNSITQDFSRRVMRRHLDAARPVSLVMAIPDHPWTRVTRDAAAVRIAMTVAEAGTRPGTLREVTGEAGLDTDGPAIAFAERRARINADLTIGADVTLATPLRANEGLCSPGVKLHGAGFIVTPAQAEHLGLGRRPGLDRHIRPYRNGRDLTGRSRDVLVIDLFGLTDADVRRRFPEVYQHVVATVRPERRKQAEASPTKDALTYAEKWWLFGKPRSELRPALAGLPRYVATVETARHRVFQFVPADVLPDNMLVCTATADAFHLGVLSSRVHLAWTAHRGGTLEDRPRYTKSACFDPFPFPDATPALRAAIAAAAEELDAFRKERLAEHPGLTLTGLYNVREALRAGTALAAREEAIRRDGLVLILDELHERIDLLVTRAYGWPAGTAEADILARLVALNRERAAEEARGLVRWLRPDYQLPRFAEPADRQALAEAGAQAVAALRLVVSDRKPTFPTPPVEQSAAVFAALAAATGPVDAAAIAAGFRQGRRIEPKVAAILASASRIGALATRDGRFFTLRRAA